MLNLKYKDKLLRFRFKNLEKTLLINKFFLKHEFLFNKKLKKKFLIKQKLTKLYFKIKKKLIKISHNKINNRCIITNRSRGVSRGFGLCRHKLREYFLFGLIPGYKKLVW